MKRKSFSNLRMNMKTTELSERKLKVGSGLVILLIAGLCWSGGLTARAQSAPATQSPQLQEIVKLTQAKMSDDVILSYIKNSGSSYNLSADDILYLNSQGVSQPVISALLQAKSVPAPAAVVPSTTPVIPATPAPPAAVVMPATPAPQVSPYPGGGVVAPSPVPPPSSEVSFSYFQTQLAPYGGWVDVPGYGPCWQPAVETTVPDWRPYFNEGHWAYTDDGWSWASDYPWGDYTFHYGRWMRDARLGWVWVPGYQWGPAWVCWRNAEAAGYCGWAPLPPSAIYAPGVGITWNGAVAVDADFGLAPDAFVFIPFGDFWVHDYVGFRAPGWRAHDLFRVSLVANHWGFVGGRFVFDGIGRDRIGILTHHTVFSERLIFHDDHIAHDFDHFHGGFDHGFDHRDDHHDDHHGF
jgi:hypothetical protein